MKINLKKARKLETKVATYLNSHSVSTTVKVLANASTKDVESAVKDGQDAVQSLIKTQRALTVLRYSLRKRISDQNQKTGINDLMNEREQLQNELKVVNSVSTDSLYSPSEVDLTLSTSKSALERGDRHVNVTVHVNVVDAKVVEDIKTQQKTLRLRLEEVESQIDQKNAGAEVTLSSEDVELLKVADLM